MIPQATPSLTGDSPRRRRRKTKDELVATPHPAWIQDMLATIQPAWDSVVKAPLFRATIDGAFPEASWQTTIYEFWCVVEAFPKYMGLTLAKTTFGRSTRDHLARGWLIGNIAVEALHAGWYLDWARAHGITEAMLTAHRPGPEVAALHEWLFSVCHRGSIAQAVAAVNFAIEGTVGEWTKQVAPAFDQRYLGERDAASARAWIAAHAKYDDLHPVEALEIVKFSARPDEQAQIVSDVQRSLELFGRALAHCHQPRS